MVIAIISFISNTETNTSSFLFLELGETTGHIKIKGQAKD